MLTAVLRPGKMAPPTLMAAAATSSLRLRWEPPAEDGGEGAHAISYVLQREGMEDVTIPKGELLTKKLTKLRPDTAYRFRLAAANSAGAGPYSEWASFRTARPMEAAPLPPVKLVCPAYSITTSSFELKWGAGDGRGNAVSVCSE